MKENLIFQIAIKMNYWDVLKFTSIGMSLESTPPNLVGGSLSTQTIFLQCAMSISIDSRGFLSRPPISLFSHFSYTMIYLISFLLFVSASFSFLLFCYKERIYLFDCYVQRGREREMGEKGVKLYGGKKSFLPAPRLTYLWFKDIFTRFPPSSLEMGHSTLKNYSVLAPFLTPNPTLWEFISHVLTIFRFISLPPLSPATIVRERNGEIIFFFIL